MLFANIFSLFFFKWSPNYSNLTGVKYSGAN